MMKGILLGLFKGTVKTIVIDLINEGFAAAQGMTLDQAKQKLIDLVNSKLS